MFRPRQTGWWHPLLALVVAALVATACGQKNPVPALPDSRPAKAKVVTNANKSHRPTRKQKTAVVLTPPGKPSVTVQAELALTDAQRTRGLMYRQHLPEFGAMLFLFDEDEVHSFWMRNTLISLDIIFISADLKIVGVVENTKPLTLSSQKVEKISRHVLEVNAGFAKAHGLVAGTTVSFKVANY